MSTVVALHWNTSSLHYAVVKGGVAKGSQIVASGRGEITTEGGTGAISRQITDQLSQHLSGRAKVVVAVPRSNLTWQHLTLPPCPVDELTDLVRLQSDQEIDVAPDEDLGFDYLPLAGDENTPYQVLTVGIDPRRLGDIQRIAREANLSLDRLVPLSSGWPALVQQAGLTSTAESQLFVAPTAGEAALWAMEGEKVVLFRQFPYPNMDNQNADEPNSAAVAQAKAIGSELRRTLLALSQSSSFGKTQITIVGSNNEQLSMLARNLDEQLEPKVQAIALPEKLSTLNDLDAATPQFMALAGIALHEASGVIPLVDLLNPRRRPKTKANYRTYTLAAIAASLLLVILGWSGYSNLTGPLEKAAEDQAALDLLEESLEQLAAYEQNATAIRNWQAETPNVLVHLQQLSKSIRPTQLSDEEFPVDRDLILQKLNLDKRRLVLDALAKDDRAVQPFERRLREADYTPERGKSGPSNQKDYQWKIQSIIEVDAASDAAANQLATVEPLPTSADDDSSKAPAKDSTEEPTS